MMHRRNLLKVAGASLVGSATFSAPALAKGRRELVMATAWPRKMTALHSAAERFAQRVAALTDGGITIKVFAGGEKVKPLDLLPALQREEIDISHGTSYYWTKSNPGFVFFATVPFGMTAMEHYAWLEHGGGQQLWDKLGAEHGIKPLAAGNTGVQTAGWFRERLRSRRDIEGKSVRFPGIGGEIMRRIGANAVTTSAADILPRLASGELDGAEWVSPWPDLEFGIQEHCKFCYYPGVHEPGHTLELNFSTRAWNSLNQYEKDIVTSAADAEKLALPLDFMAHNATALDTLRQVHGVSFLPLPNDIMRAIRSIAPEATAEFVAADPAAKAIYESYYAFMSNIASWSECSERAYWRARFI